MLDAQTIDTLLELPGVEEVVDDGTFVTLLVEPADPGTNRTELMLEAKGILGDERLVAVRDA